MLAALKNAVIVVMFVAVAGCDLRALRQDELTGGDAAVDRRVDAAADEGSEVAADAGSDGPDVGTGCPRICDPSELCDPPTMMCVPRSGPGKLSGSVTEACNRRGITARVGIAGRRQCTSDSKGQYFFPGLPEGNLALVAFKQGYKHFQAPVTIVASGTIHDIVLVPDTPGGCADPPPPDVACTCDIPGCP